MRIAVVATFVGLLLAIAAGPAAATLERVKGDCTANGTFAPGGFRDAASESITIPAEATVTYSGTVVKTPPQSPRAVDGFVRLRLPMGQSVTLGTWPDSGVEVNKTGTYTYDISDWINNIPMTLYGEHYEEGELWCKGEIEILVEGDNPLAFAAVALTVVAVLGSALSIRARGVGVPTEITEIDPKKIDEEFDELIDEIVNEEPTPEPPDDA